VEVIRGYSKPVEADSVDLAALGSILERIQFKLEEAGEAARDGEEGGVRQELLEVRRLIDQFAATTAQRRPAEVRQALSAFQAELGRDFSHSIGFSGGRPLPFAIPLKLCRYYSILGHQLH
jgi:hypothetical protein